MAELPQVTRTSILSMSLNCLCGGPGDLTRVAAVLDEAAKHFTNDAACFSSRKASQNRSSFSPFKKKYVVHLFKCNVEVMRNRCGDESGKACFCTFNLNKRLFMINLQLLII